MCDVWFVYTWYMCCVCLYVACDIYCAIPMSDVCHVCMCGVLMCDMHVYCVWYMGDMHM